MKKLSLLFFLTLSLFLSLTSCGNSSEEKKGQPVPALDPVKPNSPVAKDAPTLGEFWLNFKDALIKKDKDKLATMSYFPFLEQSIYLYGADFKAMKLDYKQESINAAKEPTLSKMEFKGGVDKADNKVAVNFGAGMVLETMIDGHTFYFRNQDGDYKWIAVLYGE